jgi:starch-binding outer membrane protein, SusD/RagB family
VYSIQFKSIAIMKKYWFKALLAGLFVIAFNQSCSDLKETLYDQVKSDEFFKSDDEFIAALGAAYTNLYGFENHGSYMALQEISSDEAMIPQRGGDWYDGGQWLNAHRAEFSPQDDNVKNSWLFLFGGVNTCNRLIYQFNKLISEGAVDPALATPFLSELRTLRALWYLWLVDGYGNVPIVDRFDVAADFKPATKTRAEVFAFIEKELNESVPNLPKKVDGSTYARINYYTGKAIQAKLYLNAQVYKGAPEFDKAIAAADEIINSGNYSLESNYFSNFNTDNSGSKEFIFAIPYDKVNAQGFNLPQMTLHYTSQQTFNLTDQPWNGYCSLAEFYNSYQDGDVRKGVSGNQAIRANFLAGKQFQSNGKDQLQDPSADDSDGPGVVFTPEINAHFPNCQRQAGVRIGKFEFANKATPNLSNDFPIFRYADILLVKAEALWRKSAGDVSALALVNQIRARAAVAPFTSLTADNLLAERGREMFFEAWRRSDLVRFGKYDAVRQWKPASQPCKQVWPIPRSQIDANSNLKQNPCY